MNSVIEHTSQAEGKWDLLVVDSPMGTFLHTRKFLGYHGSRFKDESLLIHDKNEKLIGIFPAARDLTDNACVVSHPGSSYGGIVYNRKLLGSDNIVALQNICSHYLSKGFKRLIYKVVPYIYHMNPSSDDIYSLFRCGAKLIRCDLTASIDLHHARKVSVRRQRGYKKAVKSGITVTDDISNLPAYWKVLEDNLSNKHEAKPVHTLDEITQLQQIFPESLRLVTAEYHGKVIAGTLLFDTKMVMHAQYIASSEEGYGLSALDPVFMRCIEIATEEGRRYFDFGICNEDSGQYLNEGLYKFKTEFGASGVTHQFYQIDL